jgi:hypothetical protein
MFGMLVAALAFSILEILYLAEKDGNPARIIKYRFSKALIKKLLSIDITKMLNNITRENLDELYSTDEDIISEMIDTYKKNISVKK